MNMTDKELILTKTHDFCSTKKPVLTVILIHGIAADSSTYEKALNHLETDKELSAVRFICFDLLGSGNSLKNDALNYNYKEQVEALHNAILKLNLFTPIILVGHSMGTLIVTRYANAYKNSIQKLILLSAPVYTEKELNNPAFETAVKMFKDAVSIKNRNILAEKSFNGSMEHIVLNPNNFQGFISLKVPTTLIYGNLDQFIASFNYPKLIKQNAEYLTAIKTDGRHGITRDKYMIVDEILRKTVEDINNSKGDLDA